MMNIDLVVESLITMASPFVWYSFSKVMLLSLPICECVPGA